MANFDWSRSKKGDSIRPDVGALPYIEIDQSTLQTTSQTVRVNGTAYEDGVPHQIQATYYGSFNYRSERDLLRSPVTGFNLSSPTLGAISAHGFNLTWNSFLQDPNSTGRQLLQDNDVITGSAFDDVIEPYLGDDYVYAGDGNDRLIGGLGVDRMYGQGGEDTFVIRQGSGPRWISKKNLPESGFAIDTKKVKKKGKKRQYVLVDADYINCPDFDLNSDMFAYEGLDTNNVTVVDLAGMYGGIGFFDGESNNLLAHLPNISYAQYDSIGGIIETV